MGKPEQAFRVIRFLSQGQSVGMCCFVKVVKSGLSFRMGNKEIDLS
jgi:hypothetical protein